MNKTLKYPYTPKEYASFANYANQHKLQIARHGKNLYLQEFKETNSLKDWKINRREAYPPFEEQFDMLYHDLENGTSNWLNCIRKIKETYPKN